MDPGDRLELGRLVPSGRTLLLAFGALAGMLVALLLARETSLFGVELEHEVVLLGALAL